MQALILAAISFIGWGTGDLFGTVASRKIGSISTTFWVCIFAIILFSFYIPFALPELKHYTIPLMLLNIGIGLFSIAGNLAFNESLRVGVPSLVGTISSAFTAVTIILSVIFFHDHITTYQMIVIAVIFLGVVISSLDIKELSRGTRKIENGIFLAVFTMISWGLYFTLLKLLYPLVGWFWPIYFTLWLFPVIFIYTKIRKEKLANPFKLKAIVPILLSTTLLRSGDLSFNYAIGRGFTAVTGPIGGASPVLFAILAFIFFKEKPKKQQIIGIITTLVGVTLLALNT